MKLYNLYETLLVEGQVEACVAKFGQELFSPELGGQEANTDTEEDYVELIHKFTGIDSGTRLKPEFIEMAKRLKTCVSSYPEILYTEGMAYRGEKVKFAHLLKSFDDIGDEIRTGQPFEMQYGAKSQIQSWTDDEDTAKEFFGQISPMLFLTLKKFNEAKKSNTMDDFIKHVIEYNLDTMLVPVIMRYKITPNDFLFKGKYFNYLSQHDENEVLRVDNTPIGVQAQIYPPKLSARVYDLMSTIHNWD